MTNTELMVEAKRMLAQNNIAFRLLSLAGNGAVTLEECAEVERRLGVPVVKSLLVSNRQGTRFHMVMMPGDKPFVTRAFSKGRQVSRVSFVKADSMTAMLSTPVGGCGPLSVIADTDNAVEICADSQLMGLSEVAVPVCSPTEYIALSLKDLLDIFLPALNHTPIIIDMPED